MFQQNPEALLDARYPDANRYLRSMAAEVLAASPAERRLTLQSESLVAGMYCRDGGLPLLQTARALMLAGLAVGMSKRWVSAVITCGFLDGYGPGDPDERAQ